MAVYELADDTTVVTCGRYTASLDAALDQENAFRLVAELHPDVRLAHRTWVPCADARRTGVRWTVPGAARDGYVVRHARIPAALGALDATAHLNACEQGANDTIARGDLFPPRPAFPHDEHPADETATPEPPHALALVTDSDALKYTDHGLWFTRLPIPIGCVPLGHNLAAYLTHEFPTTPGEPVGDHALLPALSFYWDALRDTLNRHCPSGRCPCGRSLDEHQPPVSRVRQYATARTNPP